MLAGQVWRPLVSSGTQAPISLLFPPRWRPLPQNHLLVRGGCGALRGMEGEGGAEGGKRPFSNKSAPFQQLPKKSQTILPPTSIGLEPTHMPTCGCRGGWEVQMYFGDCRVATCTGNNEDLLRKEGYYSGLGDYGGQQTMVWSAARPGPPPDSVNEVSSEHRQTYLHIFHGCFLCYNMRVT